MENEFCGYLKLIFILYFISIAYSFTQVQDWSGQSASDVASEICGLITVISGTTVLHSTREPEPPSSSGKI